MTPALHARKKSALTAILLTCLAYACYNISDAALKLVAGKFHFSQIMFTNSFFVIFFLSIYGFVREGKKAFRTRKFWPMTLRALFAQVTSICNILAMAHIPLATFYTLVFTSPFIVALLSVVVLKDKLEPRRLAIILAGFAVVLFVFRPGGGIFNGWMLAVLLGSFCYSCQLVIMRHVGAGESRAFMFMYGALMSMVVMGPLVPGHFILPTPFEWGLFVLMSGIGSTGLMCISYAFQTAPSAAVVAPYHYTQLIWGTLLGWFIFHEVPDMHIMTGAAAIIMAGLYLIYTETRRPRIPDAEMAVET